MSDGAIITLGTLHETGFERSSLEANETQKRSVWMASRRRRKSLRLQIVIVTETTRLHQV